MPGGDHHGPDGTFSLEEVQRAHDVAEQRRADALAEEWRARAQSRPVPATSGNDVILSLTEAVARQSETIAAQADVIMELGKVCARGAVA